MYMYMYMYMARANLYPGYGIIIPYPSQPTPHRSIERRHGFPPSRSNREPLAGFSPPVPVFLPHNQSSEPLAGVRRGQAGTIL